MAVSAIFAWLSQSQQQAIQAVTPLAGLTACSQCVRLANGERYVLRQQNARAERLGVDYQQEFQLLEAIAPLDIAPKPYYCIPEGTLLCWCEGIVPSEFSPPLLKKLAEQLATLHRFPLPDTSLARLDLSVRCLQLWQRLSPVAQQALPFNPPFTKIQPFATALCHHDVHLGNLVLQGERLILIDWEYAAVSDPALEIALFLHANSLSNPLQAVFFDEYFAKSEFERQVFLTKVEDYLPEVEKLAQLWYAL